MFQMAALHPPYALDPSHFDHDAMQLGLVRERETLNWLATALPAGYIVFHSTHLAWMENGKPRKSEADFLVLSPSGRVLMIEQKTGPLEETPDGLIKRHDGVAKSVVTQCHKITDRLRGKFKTTYNEILIIDFLLFCPDYRVRNLAAAGLNDVQIIDAPRRRELIPRIRRLMADELPNAARFAQVRDLLAQTVAVTIDPQAQAAAGAHVLTRLTDGLLEVLGGLEMAPYRLRIDGAAGCGKTRMVAGFAERWRAEGKRVLVACYNRPLADELRAVLPDDVTVETLHGVARRLLASARIKVDLVSRVNEPGFWPWLVEAATEAALERVPSEWTFDALVVDEGQDMDQAGYDLLRLLLTAPGSILWLQDEQQRLQATAPFAAEGFVSYRCRDNYRSPQRITRFLQALLAVPFTGRNPIPGDAVGVFHAGGADLEGALDARVARLCEMGYAPDQIVILSGRGQASSAAMKMKCLGGIATRRAVGFTADGAAIYTPGDLRVETIWRFKGQQAPAVVVCELEGDPHSDATQRLLYCAATRATAHLEFLVAPGSSLSAPLQRAAGQANSVRLA